MSTSKEPIRLRSRAISRGRRSLYLDIYVDGRREYEYLRLYLEPEKTKEDKERNRRTLELAEAVKARKIVDLQNGRFGFEKQYALETNFLDYYRSLCEKRLGSPGNWGNWNSCLRHLEQYCRPDTTFRDVTPEWIEGFKEFLDKDATCRDKRKNKTIPFRERGLSQNSKVSYFNKLRACINQAFEERIIPHNPLRGISGFKQSEPSRCYLTLDEVKALAATECRTPSLKNAFLFSCLTGLRKSDIEKMRWREVTEQSGLTRIIFRQKKTGGQEYLDISPQAVRYMGERRAPDDLVFVNFRYDSYTSLELRRWALAAGIQKELTFHAGRHTFAVLMLELGADIYTLQNLLGHRELKTTQIYAKMLDKRKQDAVLQIPDIDV